jgi:hypothetical protein
VEQLVLAAVVDPFLAEFGVLSLPSIYSYSGLPNQGFLELHHGSRPLWPTIHQASDTPSAFKRRDLVTLCLKGNTASSQMHQFMHCTLVPAETIHRQSSQILCQSRAD